MSVAVRPMTTDEFLAWEERQEFRWEFDGFAPVAMTGGTATHARVQRNIIAALAPRLRGSPCEVYTSDLKIRLAHSIRYPDAFVACTPVLGTATYVTEPVVVFEVLSESTASTGHYIENQEYRATPSIQRYIMLEQVFVSATVFARADEDWVGHVLGTDAIVDMPEIGISVPLTEFYEGIDFSAPAQD